MIPTSFEQQNGIFQGGEHHTDIPYYKEGARYVTKWRLNKEEIEAIVNTGEIWVHLISPMGLWQPLAFSGINPFKKLAPLICKEHMTAITVFTESEELILLRVKEDQINFRVVTEDNIWWELKYKIRGDVYKKWHGENFEYAFQEEVEVIGRGEDCPEYWWLLPHYQVPKNQVLFLKRVNKSE